MRLLIRGLKLKSSMGVSPMRHVGAAQPVDCRLIDGQQIQQWLQPPQRLPAMADAMLFLRR
jgi:hypothetical protein